MKNHTTSLGVFAALVVVGVGGVLLLNIPPHDTFEDRVVVSQEIVHQHSSDTIVSYEYVGGALPEKIVEDEVVEKRTENSYTRHLGTEHVGTEDEKEKYQVIVYEQPVYVKQGGQWYYREEAITTESAFHRGYRRGLLSYLSAAVAYAASYSGFSTSADGTYSIMAAGDADSGNSVAFSNCANAIDANFSEIFATFSGTGSTAVVTAQYRSNSLGTCAIDRGYLAFDTSSIPAGATISAATVQIYIVSKVNSVNDGEDLITITKPSAAWLSWDGSSASDSFDITSITLSAYTTFTLNATGRGYVIKAGTTELGIQEAHDIANSMTASTASGNSITYNTSEQTGTSQDPVLSVTYTVAAGGAFWQFQDF